MGMYLKNNKVVIREPQTFYFNFDLREYVGKNLNHEIECIIKLNESLAEQRIKILNK